MLKNESQLLIAELRSLFFVELRDVLIADDNLSARRRKHRPEHIEEGRLAASGGTNHRRRLSLSEFKIKIVKNFDRFSGSFEFDTQVPHLNHGDTLRDIASPQSDLCAKH